MFLKIENPYSKDTFYLILIIILIAIIILLRSCSPPAPPIEPTIITKTDTVWVKGKDSISYIPVPGPIIYHPSDTIYKDVDTVAILKDYFAKVIYRDSIKLDSFGYVIIDDTLSRNRILNRSVAFNYKFPVIQTTTEIHYPYVPKTQVYAGGSIIVGPPTGLTYIGPEFTLKTKKDQMYNIGLGLSPEGGVQYKFGTSWKIRLRK
jgi:hypothetical protein